MDTTLPPAVRVRWLVAGAFLPSPSGHRFLLTEAAFAEQLGRAGSGLNVTLRDRIGSGDASSHTLSFEGLESFQLSAVIDALPDLRTLRAVRDALSGARGLGPQDAARLLEGLGPGLLSSALAEALRQTHSPQEARDAALALVEEALFGTARDILLHPRVARLESAWRGLHWLWTHCPTAAGMDIEVLDVEPHQLVDALTRSLDVPALQRPDACFLVDPLDDVDTLRRLAALGEQACLPLVVAVREAPESEAWNRLRAEEDSRWLCAARNPVVMMAEQHGEVHRECFTSPALAMAALLAASFRDTRTFGRLVGPGSGTRAPAVWRPGGRSPVSTEVGLSLREQERLAARGVVGVGGWWDSNAVLLAAAPMVYGGGDATPLPAQLLTGRIVRLAEEIAERLPGGASQDAVSAVFTRAAEAFLPTGNAGRACQLQGKVVSTGNGERGVQVFAALKPELAGTHVQLEFMLPLHG
ncbi:MAG TPA: type VI secretion system contractile sheath large subunit [Archangium sp.]|uniref:type VI secretion system contractile sheath domain-containing protein n=1 Tax=Archangium sp. TaxID=1872627 RepID=UPI002E32491D|nr:type VI secretion system contractile sheath large subunit [Archangium sp.]HEX5745405.1 type VI secretion system contractile sheath large subunit [Archangium sp.]